MKLLKESLYKVLLLYGLVLILSYLVIRIQLINTTPILIVFSILLFLAELHAIFHFTGMLYALWPRKYQKFPHLNPSRQLQINILICVCGEPAEIVRETVSSALRAAKYYNVMANPIYSPKVIVIDDGYGAKKENWREIAALCDELGAHHLVRPTNKGFKAGNINNAVKMLGTGDPHNTIFVVLDSDFAPLPEFLTEITKPLIDKSIDFIQSPQNYKNQKTWVARAAAAHQIYFFEYICPSKAYDNALFLCGTNFAIRQSALDSVGGMDTRFITEDYSTSIELHLKGKKGVFMPKVLAQGIAPSTLKAYYNQQRRWSKGTFDASFAYLGKILFGSLTLRQKYHYLLSATYYLIGIRDLILLLAPIPFLFFGVSLIRPNTLGFLTFVYGPLFLYNFTLYLLLFREPLRSIVLDIISFPVFLQAFIGSVFKERLAFIVTIKKYEKENVFKVYKIQLIVLTILSLGLITSFMLGRSGNPLALYINYFWAGFNTLFLGLGFFLIIKDSALKDDEIVYAEKHVRVLNYNIRLRTLYASAFIGIFVLFIYLTPGYKNLFKENVFFGISNLSQEKKNIQKFHFPNSQTQILQSQLQVPKKGVYYGYYISELNTHPQNPNINVIAEEKPSLTLYYQDWGEQSGFDKEFVERIASQKVVPIITWEPWNAKKVESIGFDQTEFAPKDIANGKYDEYITLWAKEAADYKKLFFLRFAHEMNGNWYPWGVINENTPEDYINMWRHVHDIFVAQKATNTLWLWAPNYTDNEGKAQSILQFYPGDAYVDWVGFSGFNWGIYDFSIRWDTFKNIAEPVYAELIKTNKPIMVSETSSTTYGGDKTEWFIETIRRDIPSFPQIKAVVFFHGDDQMANFNLYSGMDANKVIKENITDNDYYIKNPIFIEEAVDQ